MTEKHIRNAINVVDVIMGGGKSTFAINMANANPEKRYIFVLPTLNEIERYRNSLINLEIYDPENKGKGKLDSFHRLISRGVNILTTHALILKLNIETLELLNMSDYILIIDECLQTVTKHPLKQADLKMLLKQELVKIDDLGFLSWNNELEEASNYDGIKFKTERALCDLYALKVYQGKRLEVIWNFPVAFFNVFTECYILTYCWDGSHHKAYFDLHDVKYYMYSLDNGKLVDYNISYELHARSKYKSLINVIREPRINAIGGMEGRNDTTLCMTWYKNHSMNDYDLKILMLKRNVDNFFKNIVNCTNSERMWATFKDFRPKLSGKGYIGTRNNVCFVPVGSKATNKYSHKTALAYLVNIYADPDFTRFYAHYGIRFNGDLYSLSEMLQWIWRSAIRNGKPITVYIPSERMRNLLTRWLNNDI